MRLQTRGDAHCLGQDLKDIPNFVWNTNDDWRHIVAAVSAATDRFNRTEKTREDWEQSVTQAFAHNDKLYKVQQQRRDKQNRKIAEEYFSQKKAGK